MPWEETVEPAGRTHITVGGKTVQPGPTRRMLPIRTRSWDALCGEQASLSESGIVAIVRFPGHGYHLGRPWERWGGTVKQPDNLSMATPITQTALLDALPSRWTEAVGRDRSRHVGCRFEER